MSAKMDVVSEWEQIEPELRERAYRRMDSDPQVLLEQDGWLSVTADVIFARLHGMDDEVIGDRRLQRVEPIIFAPIVRPFTFDLAEHPTEFGLPRTARYVCQNGYVKQHLDWFRYAPPWLTEPPSGNFTFSVLYLRYRRRLP